MLDFVYIFDLCPFGIIAFSILRFGRARKFSLEFPNHPLEGKGSTNNQSANIAHVFCYVINIHNEKMENNRTQITL